MAVLCAVHVPRPRTPAGTQTEQAGTTESTSLVNPGESRPRSRFATIFWIHVREVRFLRRSALRIAIFLTRPLVTCWNRYQFVFHHETVSHPYAHWGSSKLRSAKRCALQIRRTDKTVTVVNARKRCAENIVSSSVRQFGLNCSSARRPFFLDECLPTKRSHASHMRRSHTRAALRNNTPAALCRRNVDARSSKCGALVGKRRNIQTCRTLRDCTH